SLSPQVVSAAKLPILNPNEFDLWKIRIEQYFLMTDYSLWEVILNGDSPVPTRVIEGVIQSVAPTTAEQSSESLDQIHDKLQKLVSQLEIHGVSLSQEDVNLKFLHSLPSEWKTHTLIWRNKADLEEQSLDDLFNISAAANVFAVCAKLPVSSLPNVDSLSNAVDGTGSYDWSYQAEEEPTNYALMAFSPTLSNNEVPSCSKTCSKAYAQLHTQYDKLTDEFYKSQFDVISYQTGLESVEARLLVYKQNESVFEENIKLLNIKVQLRDTALVILRQKLEKAKQDRDDLKLKIEKFQTSSKNLTELLANSDCKNWPPSSLYDRFQPSGGYHDVPPPYTRTFMPPKTDLVFNIAPTAIKTDHHAFNVQLSPTEPEQDLSHTTRPSAPIIEDWVFDSEDESETKAPQPVSADLPRIMVTQPRLAHLIATKSKSSIRRHIIRSPSPKTSNPQYALKDKGVIDSGCSRHMTRNMSYLSDFEELNGGYVAFGGNPKCGKISGKGKIKTVLLRVPRENNMYNVNFKNIVPSGDLTFFFAKATIDESNLCDNGTEFKNNDLNQFCGMKDSLLSISFWVEAVNTARYVQNRVLVTKPHNKTPYELLHGRSPSIGFMRPFGYPMTILNTLDPLGKFERKVDEGFLVGYSVNSKAFRVFNSRTRIVQETLHVNFLENKPNEIKLTPVQDFKTNLMQKNRGEIDQQYMLFPMWSSGSTNPQNYDGDAAFDDKKHDFDAKKPESKVILSLSSRYRDLNAEFEDCSDNSSNEVNIAGSIVSIVGQNSLNSTNTFSAVGPLNAAVSPTYGKSSFIDASQLSVDPDMPKLEDITYSDDEDVVGAEADFNNLESSIPEEPKRIHQAFKDLSWIKAMQEELLQFKIQKVWVLVDLPYGKRAIGTKWVYMNKKDERGIVKGDILLVQIYVDDIIFVSTNKDLCKSFEKLMKDKFQMSSMGELTFFLGLQVKQKKDGIFVSQDKYVAKILRKFGLTEGKSSCTPIDIEKPLLKDPDGEDVDVHTYMSMIGSLTYLTSSRPDIMFAVCACVHFQVTLKASHLHAVKRIFRYLKGKPHLGLWYPKDSPFDLVAYSDSDHAGASLDKKSTTGGCQFLG
nr:hypothetical protein [Tanacetum cinerariifolium]